jgi:hypothetical protein
MNELEFKQLIELLEDGFEGDYTITRTNLLELLTKAKWNAKVRIKDELEALPEKNCKDHPDAPHGFDRNASHLEDRYVCECENWDPQPEQEPVAWIAKDRSSIEVSIMSLRQAAEMALDALKNSYSFIPMKIMKQHQQAEQALRDRLAQPEWVGLTDDEGAEIWGDAHDIDGRRLGTPKEIVQRISDKLKDKNGY